MWSARLGRPDRHLARYLAGTLAAAGKVELPIEWEAIQAGAGWTYDLGPHGFGVDQRAVDWVGVKTDVERLLADPGFRALHTPD